MARTVRMLFVCVENSCRSQIAEGFARAADVPGLIAHSAGSRPSGRVNPRAAAFMAAQGIDISAHTSKGLDALPADDAWDYVVTMGCGDECPHLPARHRLDWDLEDPKDLDEAGFRRVGLQIARCVRELIASARA